MALDDFLEQERKKISIAELVRNLLASVQQADKKRNEEKTKSDRKNNGTR